MLSIVIIILALAFAGPLKTTFEGIAAPNTNSSQGLDCANTSISDFDKATCSSLDIAMPMFIGAMIAIAGAIVGARLLFSSGGGE